MSVFPIKRWDVVMSGNSVVRYPMIYIKPTMEFLEFARANNFVVLCKISGTGTVYDGKDIPGVVDKSCYVPSCRPNFCEKTGWYVISLHANWYGYPEPEKLGSVEFYGLKPGPKLSQKDNGSLAPKKKNNPIVRQTDSSDNSNVNTGIIISSSIGVVAIIVILILVFVVK